MKRGVLFLLVFTFLLNMVSAGSWDAVKGHSYPRIGVQTFGGAVTEWYADYDMVIMPHSDVQLARDIKSLNPDAIILWSADWDTGAQFEIEGSLIDPFPDQWLARHSDNRTVGMCGGSCTLADITNFCPDVDGKKFNQRFPEVLAAYVDFTVFDGVMSQGSWETLWGDARGDIDLDRDGQNDNDQHGRDWIKEQWSGGQEIILSNLRNLIPEDKIIVMNSGILHSYGLDKTNGFMAEHMGGMQTGWSYAKERYDYWIEHGRKPAMSLIEGTEDNDKTYAPANPKNNFRLLRFLLTFTMLGNAYFDMEAAGTEHYVFRWYDEFDLNLGYPKTDSQSILCERVGYYNYCVWIRFFDNGVSIHNAKGKSVTVGDDDLKSLTGYAGPYYRFRGSQDPDFNTGASFDSVNLWGQGITDDPVNLFGDGIILLKEEKTVVADIIIDNVDYGTSPSTSVVELTGGWTQEDWGQDAYVVSHATWIGVHKFATATPGSAQATFTPNMGVAGEYDVYEWHGNTQNSIEATNVRYELKHVGGTKTGTINQRQNHGKWNKLGTFNFTKGTSGHLRLLASGADGVVVADAVKFVFKDGSPPPPQPIFGDLNLDRVVDIEDLIILIQSFGTSRHDLTNDSTVNVKDLIIIVKLL